MVFQSSGENKLINGAGTNGYHLGKKYNEPQFHLYLKINSNLNKSFSQDLEYLDHLGLRRPKPREHDPTFSFTTSICLCKNVTLETKGLEIK